jgi:ubiquinone biosynthesis protein Coq4
METKKNLNLRFIITTTFMVAMIAFFMFRAGKRAGFEEGASLGVKASLDTVLVMLNNQLKSDTSVTSLIIINPDTNVYILSRETLLKSFEAKK